MTMQRRITCPAGRAGVGTLVATVAVATVVTFGVVALLVSIFARKQEARTPFVRVTEVDETSTAPVSWVADGPRQYDSYARTVDVTKTRYGGSSAMPEQKLERYPWLRRLFAGYAFALDYRERRGHAYMLHDQRVTERVTQRAQPGACLHCHASVVPTYRRVGLEAVGASAGAAELGESFAWDAVMRGFAELSTVPYAEALAALEATPDGAGEPEAHPVSCVDCHDPRTMQLRVTRPGFVNGIAALAASDDALPHLPSVERWRTGDRAEPYDANRDASRQEMRTFVCAQCHVEYYCGPKETLFFPWENGLGVEQIEATFDGHTFPDGSPFLDYVHGETGAPVYKAQHPEFELWSQGIHARSGVACADCHMPYERQGAMKVSSHWVRSPLLDVSNACQPCHNVPEAELLEKVQTIQDRTHGLIERAAVAMTDMLDEIRAAQATGIDAEALAAVLALQRKSQWRLDFVASENSMGFHADQEAARILAESIDYARQAQMLAVSQRAPAAPELPPVAAGIEGVTPADRVPRGNYGRGS